MTVKQLIERLQSHNQDHEVMILDGFNGGGVPREINNGPWCHVITLNDEIETADCEGKQGKCAVVMGYGCY